ncbi:hypothetical protein Pint_16252 [Pistacia integerrima]|uniref:Uncharacterized protein n=1 Tax=Pistacia integerrima TaxID=434235 RepID=A0ACC0ZDU8_9ROSI|nr:hypothetical protein Pint_16252 [Pistacia integerrima]
MSLMVVQCASKLYNSSSRNPANTNPSSNPSGSFELLIKERYLLKCKPKEDGVVLLEDITSPEFHFVLNIPLQFPTPLSRTVYIKNMVSSLNLDPDVGEFVRAEMTEIVAETVAKSEGKEEFKILLAVQVTKVELIGKEETARIFNEIDR